MSVSTAGVPVWFGPGLDASPNLMPLLGLLLLSSVQSSIATGGASPFWGMGSWSFAFGSALSFVAVGGALSFRAFGASASSIACGDELSFIAGFLLSIACGGVLSYVKMAMDMSPIASGGSLLFMAMGASSVLSGGVSLFMALSMLSIVGGGVLRSATSWFSFRVCFSFLLVDLKVSSITGSLNLLPFHSLIFLEAIMI